MSEVQARFIESITAVSPEQWRRLARSDYPFTRYEFLLALEESGATTAKTGWQVEHLLLEQNGELIAALPVYRKSHSYGEYVFDWAWADAYHRNGLDYYPKLLAAIPFTPATGPRLLLAENTNPDLAWRAAVVALSEHAVETGASSVHILMTEAEVAKQVNSLGFDQRIGSQYHWFNKGYQSFDDFLADFSSRKRKNLRKERRRVAEQDVRLIQLSGEQITESHIQQFYRFYQMTYAKRSGHGGYLTEGFFQSLRKTMPENLLLVLAEKDQQFIAGALNFKSDSTLYGRYWGCIQELECLHFEACYYQGIEFCIEHGLTRFDPGAQGEHKIQRGFQPILIYSNHWIAQEGFREAIQGFLKQEAAHIHEYIREASSLLPFKSEQ